MEILSIFGINLFIQIIKKYIKPKFGDTGIHVATFFVAFIGIALYSLYNHDQNWKEWIQYAMGYLILTISAYELILQYIFKAFKKIK